MLALTMTAGLARGDDGLAAAVQRALPGEPPELVARLLDEKVVVLAASTPGEPADSNRVRGLAIFAQPRSRVIGLLVQTDRQGEYRPELQTVEAVERFPDGEVDRQVMRILLTRVSTWLRYQWDVAAGTMSWQLDPRFPNDLRTIEGSWELAEIDPGHTLGRFATRVDIGPALPAFFEEIATRKNLPKTLESCRRWIDSDGTYRP